MGSGWMWTSLQKLRDEIHFPDLESLTMQMHDDARRARELLSA